MTTVLVVDDDADVCGLLEAYLGLEGFDVLTAANGCEALRQLEDHQPALILLDLMMPVMDGVEFRRQQQCESRLRDIPVVCLSARHDARQTAVRLGVAGFVSKPFDLDAVPPTVRPPISPPRRAVVCRSRAAPPEPLPPAARRTHPENRPASPR